MILGTEYEREKAKLRKKRGHFTTNNDRVIRKVCRVSKKSSRGRKGENGGVKREVRLWIWFLSYIMWWWTESLETVEKDGKRRKNIWGGGSILFLWQIDAIHLNHVTPAAHSLSDQHCATPKGNWNCIVSPPPTSFFYSFLFFLGNKRRCMSSILPREWANKTTACSYMYRSPSSPKNIFH